MRTLMNPAHHKKKPRSYKIFMPPQMSVIRIKIKLYFIHTSERIKYDMNKICYVARFFSPRHRAQPTTAQRIRFSICPMDIKLNSLQFIYTKYILIYKIHLCICHFFLYTNFVYNSLKKRNQRKKLSNSTVHGANNSLDIILISEYFSARRLEKKRYPAMKYNAIKIINTVFSNQ